MTHSPNAIAALARAYRDLLDGHTNGDHADYQAVLDARSAFAAACSPATVLALVERLRKVSNGYGPRFEKEQMTTPLTPEPGLPGGASGAHE